MFNFGGVPNGVVDGINMVFTLMVTPVSMYNLFVFKNGVFQQPQKDYTLACTKMSSQITFIEPPQEGDTLYVQGMA